MSETTESMPLGSQISLFDHAMRLHRKAPNSPLPRDGEPYPDEEYYHNWIARDVAPNLPLAGFPAPGGGQRPPAPTPDGGSE